MAFYLWGASPLYENEGLKEGSIPTVTPIDKVLGEGNCGAGDRPWGGSPRMRSLSRHQLRRRPHAHQSCEATDRNSIQGRCGPVSEPTITKPSSFIRIGKSRACAAKVKRVTQGELQPGSGSRPCAESRSRAVQAARRLQQSAEAVVRLATCHWRSEGPNREEQGGATDALGSRILLRPESTDPARVDQPALSVSPPGDSGAELAPLPGTA